MASKVMEQDLRREVEEDDDGDDDVNMDIEEQYENEEAMDLASHQSQKESTNSGEKQSTSTNKKLRSRPSENPSEDQSQDKPKKRRRTSIETSLEAEQKESFPTPGPSSFVTGREFAEKEKNSSESEKDDEEEEEEGEPKKKIEEMSNRKSSHFEGELGESRQRGVSPREREFDEFPPLPIHTSTRSTRGLEELFRLPIYDSEGQYSFPWVADANRNYRDTGPAITSQEHQQHGQNVEQEKMDDKNESKDVNRMMWARKLLFLSTDLIFPGFKAATTDEVERKQFMAVRVRSSCLLQAILWADLLFFIMWTLSFACTIDVSMSVLKELHGNLILCMSLLFIFANIPRLFFGFRGNRRDKLELLALFWMMTLIVQGPLFGFILFTDVFTPVRLAYNVAMNSLMMFFIILEFFVGSYHLKNLVRDELRVIQLAKLSEYFRPGDQQASSSSRLNADDANPESRGIHDQHDLEDVLDGQKDEDSEDWSTDEEMESFTRRAIGKDADLGYKMKIRRLPPDQEEEDNENSESEDENIQDGNDDTNIVSSTSDTVRHRPVRVN